MHVAISGPTGPDIVGTIRATTYDEILRAMEAAPAKSYWIVLTNDAGGQECLINLMQSWKIELRP